jgi:anti-sigma regulatory factor (Ser/Thr protein kinase)
VTFAQTWDVSYGTSERTAPSHSPVIVLEEAGPVDLPEDARPKDTQPEDAHAEDETAEGSSVPPGLGTAFPSSLRQVFLLIGPESAKAARDFTKATLAEWGLDGLVSEAALIASELVTNAIRHGACCASVDGDGGQGRVELSWQRQASRVICMVTDRSPRPPVLGSADSDAESGRGLQVVAALAAAWGWMMLGARSKAVWAALAIRPRA